MAGLIPRGRRQPVWWTLYQPVRPLTYHAVHRMFERAAGRAGSTATLHALRHTAHYQLRAHRRLTLFPPYPPTRGTGRSPERQPDCGHARPPQSLSVEHPAGHIGQRSVSPERPITPFYMALGLY